MMDRMGYLLARDVLDLAFSFSIAKSGDDAGSALLSGSLKKTVL